MTMPWGKYRGWAIGNLPDEYLEWLYTKPNANALLRAIVEVEFLARRERQRERILRANRVNPEGNP